MAVMIMTVEAARISATRVKRLGSTLTVRRCDQVESGITARAAAQVHVPRPIARAGIEMAFLAQAGSNGDVWPEDACDRALEMLDPAWNTAYRRPANKAAIIPAVFL
ncbi:MAG: hypothetical protein OEX13_09055 [Gammaproteobacteria bacterium]|nr:hypothetical protein [Gammaproteobacteria bacterium]